jgi:hypothetical protein
MGWFLFLFLFLFLLLVVIGIAVFTRGHRRRLDVLTGPQDHRRNCVA